MQCSPGTHLVQLCREIVVGQTHGVREGFIEVAHRVGALLLGALERRGKRRTQAPVYMYVFMPETHIWRQLCGLEGDEETRRRREGGIKRGRVVVVHDDAEALCGLAGDMRRDAGEHTGPLHRCPAGTNNTERKRSHGKCPIAHRQTNCAQARTKRTIGDMIVFKQCRCARLR